MQKCLKGKVFVQGAVPSTTILLQLSHFCPSIEKPASQLLPMTGWHFENHQLAHFNIPDGEMSILLNSSSSSNFHPFDTQSHLFTHHTAMP